MEKDTLHYLRFATRYPQVDAAHFSTVISVNLITNFTDGIYQKVLTGMLLEEGIYPRVSAAPYKQYHLYLKDFSPYLSKTNPDITFVFFDVNPYIRSEFEGENGHFANTLAGLREYCLATDGTVVLSTFLLPYRGAFGNLHTESPIYAQVSGFNEAFRALAAEFRNVHIFETNALAHSRGEEHVRDFRGLYAFDTPFTNQFAVFMCREWLAYIRAMLGRVRKCIVVDLDNTLWGGVVGETGPMGIVLGSEYPGNAFLNFQRALAEFAGRGVILAINSRNNPEDVQEVFKKNPHMVLKEKDFAAIRANWNQKDQNLREIAEELNIGLDSMVFIDDDPFNRELVRTSLPEVFVPEFTLAPEEYVRELFSWNVFNQLAMTEEDGKKSRMYAEERERRVMRDTSANLAEYIAGLQITIDVRRNDLQQVPRIAQLTQKTNQFNLTTHRYSEGDIERYMDEGWRIYTGTVADRFGEYGTVLLAMVRQEGVCAMLDTFLMSCRTMGRGVEFRFFDYVVRSLAREGAAKLSAEYVATAKNAPIKDFLPQMGCVSIASDRGRMLFELDIAAYLAAPPACVNPSICLG